MSDYVPSADRSLWPAEAIRLADENGLPDHAIFYKVIDHPNEDSWADVIQLPALPRGQQSYRWCKVSVVCGPGRGNKVWIFAQKWPERESVIKAGKDVRDSKFSTAVEAA